MTRLISAVTAIGLVLMIVGAAVLSMLVPAYTRALVLHVDSPALSGLSTQETLALAEEVRAHVAGAPDALLPATLADGRPGFDERTIVHLDDVRDVIAAARIATLLSAVAAAAGLAYLVRSGGGIAAARPLRYGGRALIGAVTLTIAAALIDFGLVFTWFHTLFFAPGTWQFTFDSLIIRLFPGPFWAISGAVWGLLVLLGGLTLEAGQRILSRCARDRTPHESA